MTKSRKILKDRMRVILFFIILILFIIMLTKSFIVTNENRKVVLNESISINKGWKLINNEDEKTMDFPTTLDSNKYERYILEKEMDLSNIANANILCLVTNCGEFQVYQDEKLIYKYYDDEFFKNNNKVKNQIHNVNLENDVKKFVLRIEINIKSDRAYSYILKKAIIGNNGGITTSIFYDEIVSFIIMVVLLVFGFIMLSFYLVLRFQKIEKIDDIYYLSIFLILFSIYIFCETIIIQLFIKNTYLENVITFTSLLLIFYPILQVISNNTESRYIKRIILSLILIFCINYIVQGIIVVTQKYDFYNMLFITHILMIIAIVVAIICIIRSRIKKEEFSKGVFKAIFPLVAGTVIDLVMSMLGTSEQNGIFTQFSIFISGGILLVIRINKFIRYYERSTKSELYESMAYTDALTMLGNRIDYEKKISSIRDNIYDYSEFWCISLDLNNLKNVNDNFGHEKGDELIKSLAKLLKYIFNEDAYIYRTGGDEFIVFLEDKNVIEVNKLISDFNIELNKRNDNNDIKLSVAIGYESLENSNYNINELIVNADRLMYLDKEKYKSFEGVES